MPPTYHPEFNAAFAPMAALMASAPKPPPGDVLATRKSILDTFGAAMRAKPDVPNVSHKIYHAIASDGHKVPIWHFYRTGTGSAPSSGGGEEEQSKGTSAVLHAHGGGMFVGSVELFAKGIAARVAESGVPFFSVDYRLAPEFPAPTPVEDCYAGLIWLHEHAAELGVDKARIGVCGESAGGGIMAGVALLARDRGVSPGLKKQVLVYPMLDDRNMGPDAVLQPLLTWDYDNNRTGWGALLGDRRGGEDVNCYAAPARAESLKGLPSTYIDVGSLDIFLDEDIVYARRLAKEGVEVELHVWPGVPHGFDGIAPGIGDAKKAVEARDRAVLSL